MIIHHIIIKHLNFSQYVIKIAHIRPIKNWTFADLLRVIVFMITISGSYHALLFRVPYI